MSNRESVLKLATILPKNKPFKFIDLGCGVGHVLRTLSEKFPLGNFVGVELSPVLYLFAKMINRTRKNVKITWCNLFKVDLSEFDYIYIFLSPRGNERLLDKLKLTRSKIIISNSFPLADMREKKVIHGSQSLHVYYT